MNITIIQSMKCSIELKRIIYRVVSSTCVLWVERKFIKLCYNKSYYVGLMVLGIYATKYRVCRSNKDENAME